MKKLFYIPLAVIFLNVIVTAQANSILFRFNANHDFSQNISSAVEVSNVEFAMYLDSTEATARGLVGWGYYAPIYSVFSGDSSYLKSIENVRVTFVGDHMLSGEMWFNTEKENGSLFSWNDSTQKHGIDVYLSDGKLKLERRFFDTTLVLTSNSNIGLNRWNYIIWTLNVSGSEVTLEFYINSDQDISETYTLNSEVGFAIVNTPLFVGRSTYKPELQNFKGILSAINFKSYIPQVEYLNTNVPFDGSEYFGIPTYHNYNIGAVYEEVDQIISYNPTEIMESAVVPYMDDDFIPQGITNSYEDNENYFASPMVYTSLYNKTVDGVTGRKRSIIVEMDPNNSYKVRRCFELSGYTEYRHNGGLAFFNDKIYISTGSNIEVFNIPDYTEGSDKYVKITRNSIASVSSIASYMTYYKDTVWVGDFVTSGVAYIKGYPLDETGKVINSVTPKKYMVLQKTQGVAWTNVNGKDYLMISTSYGDAFSKIYRVSRTELSSTNEPSVDGVFTLPAGGEDLTFDKDQNLISQSESGAKYFQKRPSSPWGSFFPFIYKISYETLFGDIVSVEEENSHLPKEFDLYNNYPNPFNPSTVIKVAIPTAQHVSLKIYNIHGELVTTLADEVIGAGYHQYRWNGTNNSGSKVASGIYFYQIITNGFNQAKKMMLLK